VASATDDYNVITSLWRWIAPCGLPASIAAESLAQHFEE
jgi:hypothetical protein